jgi:hypothetical protein
MLTFSSGQADKCHLRWLRNLYWRVARRPGFLRTLHIHIPCHVVRLSIHTGKDKNHLFNYVQAALVICSFGICDFE